MHCLTHARLPTPSRPQVAEEFNVAVVYTNQVGTCAPTLRLRTPTCQVAIPSSAAAAHTVAL